MPRVDQYRDRHFSTDYESQPSASGALLFAAIVAAIIIAGFLWAAYVPQPEVQPGAMNTPSTNAPATAPRAPATQPRSPAGVPTAPAQPGGPNR